MHNAIRTAVDAGVTRGETKQAMFERLAPKYDVSWRTIRERYHNSPDQMRMKNREYAHRAKQRLAAGTYAATSRPQVAKLPTPLIQGGVQVVSIERALGMLQAAEQFGFAKQVSLTFLA
jgi:hypothetical protein